MGFGEVFKQDTTERYHYKFNNDGNYDDISGQGKTLTVAMGSPTFGTNYGRYGGGVLLNSAVLYTPADTTNMPGHLSISFKLTTLSIEQTFFAAGDHTWGNRCLRLYLNSSNKLVLQVWSSGNSSSPWESLISNQTFVSNVWYTIDLLIFSTTRKIYVNGALDIESNTTWTLPGATAANCFLGANMYGGAFQTTLQNVYIDDWYLETITRDVIYLKKLYTYRKGVF